MNGVPAVVHVVPQFGASGPERAILTFARLAPEQGFDFAQRVVSLTAAASPLMLLRARGLGLPVHLGPDDSTLREILECADAVVLHFWNHPATARWLRADLPAMRLLVWSKVYGAFPPQRVTTDLVDFADHFASSSAATLELADVTASCTPTSFALSPFEPERLAGVRRRRHRGFKVGYIGTVNFAKMHRDFVAMHAAADIEDLEVIVCGGGAEDELAVDAERLGVTGRFDFRGYVDDVGAVLAELDVLGYPLCDDTYATSEKAIQEAMWCGIPPLILPSGAAPSLVRHGRNALIARDTAQYSRLLETLRREPAERRRLGRNARAHARRHFRPERQVAVLGRTICDLLRRPKRRRSWPRPCPSTAAAFADGLGDPAGAFARSVAAASADDALAADRAIGDSPLALTGGEGGIVQYRNADPHDPLLRLWSGIVLAARGDTALARRELDAARALGMPEKRIAPHLRKLDAASPEEGPCSD